MKIIENTVKLLIEKGVNSTFTTPFHKNLLTDKSRSPYALRTVAKSTAGRGNPVLLHMANDNTPQACFFIRSTNTSKASPKWLDLLYDGVLWARFALDCFPYVAVFPPRRTLSPYNTVESVSDSPKNSHMELSAMIYSYLAGNRNQNLHSESTSSTAKQGKGMLYTFLFLKSKIRATVFAYSYDEAKAKFSDPVIFCYRKEGRDYAN